MGECACELRQTTDSAGPGVGLPNPFCEYAMVSDVKSLGMLKVQGLGQGSAKLESAVLAGCR
jgi:hypothetical protein